MLGWVADDGRRRGDGAAVVVAHSTSPFATAHLDDPAGAEPALVAALDAVVGAGRPAWTHVHRWAHARPAEAREAPFHPGAARVGLCGDGWGSPRSETACVSGTLLGEALAADLVGEKNPRTDESRSHTAS